MTDTVGPPAGRLSWTVAPAGHIVWQTTRHWSARQPPDMTSLRRERTERGAAGGGDAELVVSVCQCGLT
jgi:hypothetical protein